MFHTVTEFSPTGEKLKTYEAINDAIKDRNVTRSTILAHINGQRKVCLWFSHIYRNKIVLENGKEIEVMKPAREELKGIMVFSKPTLKRLLEDYNNSDLTTDEFIEENWKGFEFNPEHL